MAQRDGDLCHLLKKPQPSKIMMGPKYMNGSNDDDSVVYSGDDEGTPL